MFLWKKSLCIFKSHINLRYWVQTPKNGQNIRKKSQKFGFIHLFQIFFKSHSITYIWRVYMWESKIMSLHNFRNNFLPLMKLQAWFSNLLSRVLNTRPPLLGLIFAKLSWGIGLIHPETSRKMVIFITRKGKKNHQKCFFLIHKMFWSEF